MEWIIAAKKDDKHLLQPVRTHWGSGDCPTNTVYPDDAAFGIFAGR